MVERWKANSKKRETDGGMDRTFKSALEAVLSKWPLKTMGAGGGGVACFTQDCWILTCEDKIVLISLNIL